VVYQSVASNLGSGPGCPHPASDKNLLPDVYLFDRLTRCVTRISGSPAGEWWTPSVAPAIDGAGTVVVFSSTQPIDESDPSTDFDLFLFLRASSETPTVSDRGSVLAALACPGALLPIDAEPNPEITVLVYNNAPAPRDILAAAGREADRIFSRAGVRAN
jgi:hypothetical protein